MEPTREQARRLMAELFGRATGCCRGKGGSMHLCDLAHGILGTNGVVGANLPIATGTALAAQLRGTGQVTVAFFGDGAANTGAAHEAWVPFSPPMGKFWLPDAARIAAAVREVLR